MADYRLIYTSLKTGTVVGELPVISVSIDGAYNSTGSLDAVILLEDTYEIETSDGLGGSETITSPQLVSLLTLVPASIGIYLERDGVIIWGGILWTMDLSVAGSTISIGASGMMSYLERVHVYQDLSYSSVDQTAIAKDLLERAMAKPGADIGLTANTVAASKSRDRQYPALERKTFGSAIMDIADVNEGFSWRFEHSWASGETSVNSVLDFDTSELGRETGFVFELGTNVSLLDLSVDGTEVVNYAEAWGQGDGEAGFFRSSFNSALLLTAPLLELVEDFTDIKETATLQDKAEQMIARGSAPIQRIGLEVFPDAIPSLGSYEVGDRVTVRGSYGGLEISGLWRIVEFGLAVASNSLETITLTLVPQGAF